jgi:hypothetical protein
MSALAVDAGGVLKSRSPSSLANRRSVETDRNQTSWASWQRVGRGGENAREMASMMSRHLSPAPIRTRQQKPGMSRARIASGADGMADGLRWRSILAEPGG